MSNAKGYSHSVMFVPRVMPHRHRPAFLMDYQRIMGPGATGPSLMDMGVPALSERPIRDWQPSQQALENIASIAHFDPAYVPYGGFNAASTDELWTYIARAEEPDPTSMEEMLRSRNKAEWIVGLELELTKLQEDYKAWVLIPPDALQPGAKVFNPRVVFKTKYDAPLPGEIKGRIRERKVRVTIAAMSKMLHQGIDYDEKASTTVQWHSIRLLLAYAVQYGLKIKLKDMESFYLCGHLPEENREICMRQVQGFETVGKEQWLCKILKGLYGLPHAGNLAQKKLADTLNRTLRSHQIGSMLLK
jgi:hypothetical protein